MRFGLPVIVLLGVALAWAGVAEGVDSIVYYVFAICDNIPNDPIAILKPVFNPPPMYTHAYRPLSTAMVKLGSAVFGRDTQGLQWMTFAHGLLLVPYGLGARRFLRVHGLEERLATVAAICAMLTPTVLFSAWTIPEFDMIGGAIVLFAAAELRVGRLRRALPLLALAILTKETTAIFMFAYLLAYASTRAPGERKRAWWIAGGYFGVLLAAVSPILLVRPPVTHSFSLIDERFEWMRIPQLCFHNLSQLFYVLGPAGALLLLGALGQTHRGLHLRAWRRSAPKARTGEREGSSPRTNILAGLGGTSDSESLRGLPAGSIQGRRGRWPLLIGAAALLGASPLLRHYNHYESVVFSNWGWVLVWMVVAIGALSWMALRDLTADRRILARCILLGFGGLLAGPILASFSRADLSARLYAPVIPMLAGLALTGALQLWGTRDRWLRIAGAALAACFVWLPLAGAVNAWQTAQARFPVELASKRDLIATLAPPCPAWVFYTNRDQELAQEELELLGDVPSDVRECTQLIQLSVTETGPGTLWQYEQRLDGYDQYRNSVDTREVEELLRVRRALPHPVHLYVQGPRSAMDAASNEALNPSFEWATDSMPEIDEGYMKQTMGMIYVADTPLERLFQDAAPYTKRRRAAYIQLPLWLHELPRRIIGQVALVEHFDYQATLYTIPYGAVPTGRPDPKGPPRQERP